jgi:F-type H+-transporting ATPase subunit gamma
MDSMKDIRTRRESVQKTMKITKAMYLMSSAKLKKARARLDATAPYFLRLQDTIADILAHSPELESIYFNEALPEPSPDDGRRRGYIVITSDKGLAGAYNNNIIKLAEKELSKGGNNTIFTIGASGKNYFKKHGGHGTIDEEYSYAALDPTIWRARDLMEHVISLYRDGELDELYIIYTKMRSAISMDAEMLRILPLTERMFNYEGDSDDYTHTYMPSPSVVLHQIVPNYAKGLIFGAMIEAYASEQNARMTAMDNATTNAEEIIRDLTLLYNRVRQAAITTELNEVVSGAAAQE